MNWDNAYKWADKANDEKQLEQVEPRWSWDCGLKLDYDGGLLRVSSRFYQERENIFSGSVSFLINDNLGKAEPFVLKGSTKSFHIGKAVNIG